MREAVLEGMSFCMVLLLGLCADGLAERPGGLVVLLVGMLLSGVPLILSQLGGCGHRSGPGEPGELDKSASAGRFGERECRGYRQRTRGYGKSASDCGFGAKRKPLGW